MTLATVPADALAPLLLPERLRLTADQFEAVCHANPDAVLELDASGQLIHMTPTGSETGARNSALLILLGMAVRASGLPLKPFDSSTGFRLPDGSVLSPDAWRPCAARWPLTRPTAPSSAGRGGSFSWAARSSSRTPPTSSDGDWPSGASGFESSLQKEMMRKALKVGKPNCREVAARETRLGIKQDCKLSEPGRIRPD